MIEPENENEYSSWNKDFSAFVGSQVNKNKHSQFFRNKYIHAFSNDKSLKKH